MEVCEKAVIPVIAISELHFAILVLDEVAAKIAATSFRIETKPFRFDPGQSCVFAIFQRITARFCIIVIFLRYGPI